jgi:hypothetical protein
MMYSRKTLFPDDDIISFRIPKLQQAIASCAHIAVNIPKLQLTDVVSVALIGYHTMFFSYTSLAVIALAHGFNYLLKHKLKASDRTQDLFQFMHPVVCESSRHIIQAYVGSCLFSKIISLTAAEAHLQIENDNGIEATIGKSIVFITKALLDNMLCYGLGFNSYLAFGIAQLGGNLLYDRFRGREGMLYPSLKALSSCGSRLLISPFLGTLKKCELERDCFTVLTSIGIFMLHDFIREGICLTKKVLQK